LKVGKMVLRRNKAALAEVASEVGNRAGLIAQPQHRATEENIASWRKYGFIDCPGRPNRVCADAVCQLGVTCQKRKAKGLWGDGSPLNWSGRPRCNAQTRSGNSCKLRVVPGKCRCRLHGGLSTGPKTPEGKARIAAANRLRWETRRQQLNVQTS
jgi:hypothetical protein